MDSVCVPRCGNAPGGNARLDRSNNSPGSFDEELHGCIDTMPMGDHAVVDYAQDGHGNSLRQHGLFSEDGYLHGQRGTPDHPILEGLFINDYFVLD